MKHNTRSKFVIALSILAISLAIPGTVLLSQGQTHTQQEAAMKMPMSPMPSQMPVNGNTVTILMVHKGMTMTGGMMNGPTPIVEQSDTTVDTTIMAVISPTMATGNTNGGMNMCGSMDDMFFSPKAVTIPVGTTVKWVNMDPDMNHDTTSTKRRSAESWDSGDLKPGESFVHTFTHVGVYPYDCDIHPWMRGVIKVVHNMHNEPTHTPNMSPMPKMTSMPTHMPMMSPAPTHMPMMSPMVTGMSMP